MTLFSVVIPTYNRADVLAETLDSVLAQECGDFDVIVVDDGSTDGTSDILEAYADRVNVCRQPNRGAGAARNAGIQRARGRYIAFLDSDDLWFPWTLAAYAAAIRDHHEPAFLTGCPYVFVSHSDLAGLAPGETRVAVFPHYFASSEEWRWFSASSFVVRRDCLEAVGGFFEGWGSEDADLPMRLGLHPGFVHLLAPYTFGYREHTSSLKSSPTYSLTGSRTMLGKEREGRYPGGPQHRRDRARILTRQARPVALSCLRAGMPREAWELYRATFFQHLALGRWKFLIGFPLMALAGSFGVRAAIGDRSHA